MALNLGVTSCQSLEISLDQFVRGEVLEGSNAYYCEKCKEKVSVCKQSAQSSSLDATVHPTLEILISAKGHLKLTIDASKEQTLLYIVSLKT